MLYLLPIQASTMPDDSLSELGVHHSGVEHFFSVCLIDLREVATAVPTNGMETNEPGTSLLMRSGVDIFVTVPFLELYPEICKAKGLEASSKFLLQGTIEHAVQRVKDIAGSE